MIYNLWSIIESFTNCGLHIIAPHDLAAYQNRVAGTSTSLCPWSTQHHLGWSFLYTNEISWNLMAVNLFHKKKTFFQDVELVFTDGAHARPRHHLSNRGHRIGTRSSKMIGIGYTTTSLRENHWAQNHTNLKLCGKVDDFKSSLFLKLALNLLLSSCGSCCFSCNDKIHKFIEI